MSESIPSAPYVLIPERLCIDLRDSPVAIGVYALIARLFLLTHTAIPLSAGDIERFDRQTSYGQARRALDRLNNSGWLRVIPMGRKNAYLPTWGLIRGSVRPWDWDLAKFGRPPHVRTYRIGAEQFDGIAYLTPHSLLTAVIRHGLASHDLHAIGLQLLETAGLRKPILAADESAHFFDVPEPIDQLIPQVIGQDTSSNSSSKAVASRCASLAQTDENIPWDSWAMNQQTNQQATMVCSDVSIPAEADRTPLVNQQTIIGQPVPASAQVTAVDASAYGLDPALAAGHQMLNADRTILLGEWIELARLQQVHGVEPLLIWQARASRRSLPIELITPLYYHACAAQEAARTESQHEQAAVRPISVEAATPSRRRRKAGRAQPSEELATQLRSLGIRAMSGLGQCDSQLVARWVAASRHPDWACIWDDPGAAARALILRGEEPPDAAMISRRAAARRRETPADWAKLAAEADQSRLSEPLSDLHDQHIDEAPLPADVLDGSVGRMHAPNSGDDPAERLRMTLRLYTPTRAAFQAVERLAVELRADQLLVIPGRSEDRVVLSSLIPVITRVAEGRKVVLAS